MPTVTLANRTLYFSDKQADEARLPPLVLVHGAGGSRLDWPPELRRLAGPRVITLDLPGHGRSSGPGCDRALDYADAVCTLLDALHIERAIVAGHSMGGAIALEIGLDWPERVAGLVLVATGSKLPVDPGLPQRVLDDLAGAIDWIVAGIWSEHTPSAVQALGRQRMLETLASVLHDDYVACQSFDVRAQLEQIAAPTLVIGAAEDRMVPLKFSRTLAERIPQARLVVIEGAGHMVVLEQARQVAGAVAEWLAEQNL